MKASGFTQVGAGQGIQEGVMFPGNLWETTNALTGEAIDFPSHGVSYGRSNGSVTLTNLMMATTQPVSTTWSKLAWSDRL